MRLITTQGEVLLGEAFSIDGSECGFAVHPAPGLDAGSWAATHLDTGLRIALADTIDEAIQAGTETWQRHSAQEIEDRISAWGAYKGNDLRVKKLEPADAAQ